VHPALLPPGSGPDLTHHLLLIDYIERHGTLVHDADAWQSLGEMAYYTPGVHILSVLAATFGGSHGFFTIYPVVAASVALKFGFFALVVLRLLDRVRSRVPIAIAGTALLYYASDFTIDSFAHDSFLAQVVAELFALVMLWALIAWAERPTVLAVAIFGMSGAAAFLTWPLWVGPLVVALALTAAVRADMPAARRLRDVAIAVGPVVVVAALHTTGRANAVAIVGTSGAVAQPSAALLGWWLPPLALVGLALAIRKRRDPVLICVVAGLAAQTGALWWAARSSGAATPYMAIKMTYLAIYPLIAAATFAVATFIRWPVVAWLLAGVLWVGAAQHLASLEPPGPTVSADLWAAGMWTRDHLPPDCIDYLVGNEYTAYWLHLAMLGNPRMAERSANNDLYLPQPSFARWIVGDSGPPYAIVKMSVLPVEIRDRTRVLQRFGDAAVVERSASSSAECRAYSR
jgi:hypothetical protein